MTPETHAVIRTAALVVAAAYEIGWRAAMACVATSN
jgi:hypothetical protein